MIASLLSWLEASALSSGLRASLWVYPLVNALHVVGIALLVGPITVFDLRLLGRWPTVPVDALAKPLLAAARAGFALAACAGVLMFVARPQDYAFNSLFWLKLALIGAGLLNAVLLQRRTNWSVVLDDPRTVARVRLGATLSLTFWLSALLAGRMIGYR